MAKIKLTKTAVDAAQPQAQTIELRDTVVPSFLCKITPTGRKVFMLPHPTSTGERRKPADMTLHAQACGEALDAATLIPHMLKAFVARDRGFRKGSTSRPAPVRPG